MNDTSAELAASLGAVIQAYQAAVDDHDRELARILGVNRTDLRCLEILLGQPTVSPTALAELLGLTSGSVTAMLDRLGRLGFLERSPDPDDRRRSVITITDPGRDRCNTLLEPLVREGSEMLRARFGEDELQVVARFLTETTALQRAHVNRLMSLHPDA